MGSALAVVGQVQLLLALGVAVATGVSLALWLAVVVGVIVGVDGVVGVGVRVGVLQPHLQTIYPHDSTEITPRIATM